jgi:hypothetical protein
MFWLEILKKRDHLEDVGVDGQIILKGTFKKWDMRLWTKFVWFRIGINGGLLSKRQ